MLSIRKKIFIPVAAASLCLGSSLSSIAMAQSIEDKVAPVSSNIEKVIDGKNFSISPKVVGKITDEELKAISQQANGTGDNIISNVIEGTNQISPFSKTLSLQVHGMILTLFGILLNK